MSENLWLQLKDGIVTFRERINFGLFKVFVELTDISLLNSRGSCKFSISTVSLWAT